MTKRQSRRKGRRTLGVIALLLLSSALMRAGIGAGAAFARADSEADLPVAEPLSCAPADDIAPVLAALKDRETQISQREAQVQDRLRALAVAEDEIARKTEELIAAEEALRDTIALAETAAEDDISRLVTVYQAMKPKDAAALFEEMAPDFAAGFLGRMQPDAAAGVMAGLSPQAAYTISVILAGRNAKVPTE